MRTGAVFYRNFVLRVFGDGGAGLLSTSAWCSAGYVRVAEQVLNRVSKEHSMLQHAIVKFGASS